MTTLIAFVSIDPHGPSAFYLVSDSRITWDSHSRRWDAGRKVYAAQSYPHVFGYSGDVVFPSLVLSQIVQLIDSGAMPCDTDAPEQLHSKIVSAIRRSFELRQNAPTASFDILHASRHGLKTKSGFALWQLSYVKEANSWIDKRIDITLSGSNLVLALGSGTAAVRDRSISWRNSAQGGTSRSIYSAFCDALSRGKDSRSGGAPQLVGIYRSGAARAIGVVHQGVRYFGGLPVPDAIRFDKFEWRDELFQRIDGETLTLLKGAQPHARPKPR